MEFIKKKTIVVSINLDTETRAKLSDYAIKHCEGNESLAVRKILRNFFKKEEKIEVAG